MTFSNLNFIFRLLPIFLIIYFISPIKLRAWILLIASLGFYYVNEPRLILVLLAATAGNIILSYPLKHFKSKILLGFVVIMNVALLATFKGANFVGIKLIIPLGISYYIFKMISYQVDLYKGKISEVKPLYVLNYFLMFPQIISGPIARYDFVENNPFWIKSDSTKKERFHLILLQLEEGLKLFAIGLFMKVIIADHLAILWKDIKTIGYESISTPLAWLGAYTYSFNLYFDFWGYSLMAAGLGVMLGFSFIINFDQPYASASISEFYRRWHSTLGTWFRDYIYFPLGGSRRGKFITVINLIVVWFVTGIWHGNTINFALWAGSICVIIIFEKLVLSHFPKLFTVIGHFNVLVVIPITWVIFALRKLSSIKIYMLRLFPVIDVSVAVNKKDVFYCLQDYWFFLVLAVIFTIPFVTSFYRKHKNNIFVVLIVFVLFWASIFSLSNSAGNPFMYLRF